jgi:cell division protein FtsW (lipid II flippase)
MKKNAVMALVLIGIALAGNLIAYKMFHVPRQTEMIVLFVLAVAYPILRNPLFGVYAVFLLLPFVNYARRLYYLVYMRPGIDPLLMTGEVLLALIMAGLFFELRERGEKDREIKLFRLMVFMYFCYMAMRVFVYTEVPLDQAAAAFKFYGPAVLFFFVGCIYGLHFRHVRIIWGITTLIGVLAALYGIKQLYFGYSEAEKIWLSSIKFSTLVIFDIVRPFSFFSSPATFGDYLLLAVIGVLMLWHWENQIFRMLSLIVLPVLFCAVLITSVRSNWIGFVLVMVLWFAFTRVKGAKKRIMVLVAIAALYFAGQAVSDMFAGESAPVALQPAEAATSSERYMQLLVTSRSTAITDPMQEHSFLSRIALWQYMIRLSTDPQMALLGRGLGGLNADSLYITYLAEFGYPGMLFIIFILGAFVFRGLKIIDTAQSPDVVALARGITVMNMVFAIVSITGSHIHAFPGDVYFWFFNGVLVKLPQLDAWLATKSAPAAEGA